MLPDAALENTPFDHVCLFYQTVGHPPWDGHGGGFGTPHLDFHFNTVSYDELSTYTCGGEMPCDATDPANALFFMLPPADKYPLDYYVPPTFGSHAIELMGNHLLRRSDNRYYSAYDNDPGYSINLTSPDSSALIGQLRENERPLWVDCDNQMLQLLSGVEPILDSGCRIPLWWPPLTPVYSTYDGTVIAAELMTPLSAMESPCDYINNSMTQPSLEWGWASYSSSYGPVGYFMRSSTYHDTICLGFELNTIGSNIQCNHMMTAQLSWFSSIHESMVKMSLHQIFPLIILSLLITSLYGVVLAANRICTHPNYSLIDQNTRHRN